MRKKILILVALVTLLLVAYLIFTPYIRSLKHTEVASIDVNTQVYDCAGEHCVGFFVKTINPKTFSEYQGKHLIPYNPDKSRDQLQNDLANLIGAGTDQFCLKGYLHKYTVNVWGFLHPAAGSYKVQVESIQKDSCESFSS